MWRAGMSWLLDMVERGDKTGTLEIVPKALSLCSSRLLDPTSERKTPPIV